MENETNDDGSVQSLIGRIVTVEQLDATEIQLVYEDGRVVRVFAQDPEGFSAWLYWYVPESRSEPTVAALEDEDDDPTADAAQMTN